jgi:hypothetical protein
MSAGEGAVVERCRVQLEQYFQARAPRDTLMQADLRVSLKGNARRVLLAIDRVMDLPSAADQQAEMTRIMDAIRADAFDQL